MGVTVIQERNALSDFLRGLSPIVDAWGQRYKERGKANILNEIDQYQNAKPQFMDVGAIAGDAYRPASADMFSDTGNTGGYSGISPQVNTQTSPEELMRMSNPGMLGEIAKAYNFNSTAQADYDKNRAIQKMDLQKRGADYFGGSEMKALIDGADQKRRVNDLSGLINSGATYQDIMRAAGGVSLANGDLGSAISAFGGIKPNVGQSSINLGGKTVLLKHDPANPAASSYESFDNSATPGQVMADNQQNLNRDHDTWKTESGRKFEWDKMSKQQELTLQRLKYQADLGDASAQKQLKATQDQARMAINAHQGWQKNNPLEPETKSPYYTGAQNAANFLNGGSGGAGTSTNTPAPMAPTSFPERRVPTDQFQSMIAKVKADAQNKGHSLSDAEAIDILGKNYNIFWKSSTER